MGIENNLLMEPVEHPCVHVWAPDDLSLLCLPAHITEGWVRPTQACWYEPKRLTSSSIMV